MMLLVRLNNWTAIYKIAIDFIKYFHKMFLPKKFNN